MSTSTQNPDESRSPALRFLTQPWKRLWAGPAGRAARRVLAIRGVRRAYRSIGMALGRLYADDGWAMASHLALSALMALFPFLIFVAALAGFIGQKDLADGVADLLFQTVPPEVARPIADEVHRVVDQSGTGVLTISIVVTIYLASNGVEAVRAALSRAYGGEQVHSFLVLRLQSVFFVVIGAVVLLVLALLGVLGPLIWSLLERWFPLLEDSRRSFELLRYVIVGSVLTLALIAAHLWLPGKHSRQIRLWPGIGATLILWLIATAALATYLSRFANYVSTYAGLAGVVTVIFYLYVMSLILIFGAELNAAVARTSPRLRPTTPVHPPAES